MNLLRFLDCFWRGNHASTRQDVVCSRKQGKRYAALKLKTVDTALLTNIDLYPIVDIYFMERLILL